jgi:hypothetical protein
VLYCLFFSINLFFIHFFVLDKKRPIPIALNAIPWIAQKHRAQGC